jgi:hypothetical protein
LNIKKFWRSDQFSKKNIKKFKKLFFSIFLPSHSLYSFTGYSNGHEQLLERTLEFKDGD